MVLWNHSIGLVHQRNRECVCVCVCVWGREVEHTLLTICYDPLRTLWKRRYSHNTIERYMCKPHSARGNHNMVALSMSRMQFFPLIFFRLLQINST